MRRKKIILDTKYLVISVIRSEFANAVKETAETETEEREAEYGQNNNNVVRRHDFFPDHLTRQKNKNKNLRKTLKQISAGVYLAIILVVAELAVDPAVTT